MAVTAQPHQRLTVDEFFALPGEQRHTQLIDGEIVVNAPSMRHQRILYWMAYELETFRRANPHLGSPGLEMDVPVGNHDVYLPDLWWSSPSRLPGPIRFEAMPDLAIEIGSPSTWRFDVGTKKRGYEAAGLPELWLVDTVRDRVILHRRSHPDVTAFDVTFEVTPGEDLTSPLLPGLTLDVAELFDR
jgi:Uma2 family endonuclease